MKGAQRVSSAIHFESPDRVPYIGYNYFYPLFSDILPLVPLTPNSWQPPNGHYPHVHQMQLQYRMYKWEKKGFEEKPPKNWKKMPHTEVDEWGVIWEDAGDGTMGWPVEGPLKNWEDIDNVVVPDGSNPERYKFIKKVSRIVPRSWKYRMGLIDNFLFERTHFLRGWDPYMRDLIKNPEKISSLIKHIMPYYTGLIHQLKDLGAQCVFTTDDWGTQEDVFISPRLFDKIFFEPYKEIVDLCHDLGMDFWLHSCGNIGKFIPKFIDIGIDAIELDAPHMTGIETLKKFKGQICFVCCIDIQKIYPYASPLEIFQEVKNLSDNLATEEGGLIFIDYSGANSVLNVPKKNIKAFYKAVKNLKPNSGESNK